MQQLSNGGASRQRYKWVTSELTVPSTARLASPDRQNPLIGKEGDFEGTTETENLRSCESSAQHAGSETTEMAF